MAIDPDSRLTAREAAALDELDQQRTRAETTEAERDQAQADIDERDATISSLNQDLDFQTKAAFANQAEGNRLREQLNRANTERQTLAAELADTQAALVQAEERATEAGRLHAMLIGCRGVKEKLLGQLASAEAERDEAIRQINAIDAAAAGGLGSSRRAQDVLDLRVAVESAIHDRLADAYPHIASDPVYLEQLAIQAAIAAVGVVPASLSGYALGYAAAIARLRDDARYTHWRTALPQQDPAYGYWQGPARQHLADYLETVGVDDGDACSPPCRPVGRCEKCERPIQPGEPFVPPLPGVGLVEHVQCPDPVNEEERPEDAARRFAGELERLSAGLTELGITVTGPLGTAAVDSALAALARRQSVVNPWTDDDAGYDDWLNDLMMNTPDSWDDDAAAEQIVSEYVRELERRLLAAGGSLERWPVDDEETAAGPARPAAHLRTLAEVRGQHGPGPGLPQVLAERLAQADVDVCQHGLIRTGCDDCADGKPK